MQKQVLLNISAIIFLAIWPAMGLNALAQASPLWQVKPDTFRIPNASIPNVGWINNEVWLIVGGPGGIRLYRSPQGDNSTLAETIPGLSGALTGAGYAPTETIPRVGKDGVRELYVLGLGPPGTNRSGVFRLRENNNGVFVRDPQEAVYTGAPTDNQFLGVPDIYTASPSALRMIYVARGAARQNSRTALSTDGGKSFSFEFDDPFNDLTVQSPGPGNTNVDPAVVKLGGGGYLAMTMRLKKLYLFVSADGKSYTATNGGAAVEPTVFSPLATGYYDPTLVQMPDGKIWMYVTLEEQGTSTSVARAEIVPAAHVTSVSAADYQESPLATESIVAAFGIELATAMQAGSTLPLPTMLVGTSVSVVDSLGLERLAPLFYVSPEQINYQMPPGTAPGPATIAVRNGAGRLTLGTALVSRISPGIFTVEGTGKGLAAALVLRIKADGSFTYEPTTRLDETNQQWIPMPIGLGVESEQVFLVLFGTGIRSLNSLSSISAQIGGNHVEVTYAGPQNDYVGLDQINIRLPHALSGMGAAAITLKVEGEVTNSVDIVFR